MTPEPDPCPYRARFTGWILSDADDDGDASSNTSPVLLDVIDLNDF